MRYTKRDPNAPDCMDCANHIWVYGGFMEPPEPPEPGCGKFPNSHMTVCDHFERSHRCCECEHGKLGTVLVFCYRVKDTMEAKCGFMVTEGLPYGCEYDTMNPCNIGCDHFEARDVPTGNIDEHEGYMVGL